ncbi:MAG: hypothetical protein JXR68_13970, partial [Bacteroidales bacterium]|nr:hypothetical protein [Bacteroidales bacterium]
TAFDDGKKESYDELMPLIKQKEEELAQERQKAEQEHQKIIETAKFLKTHNVVDKIIAEKNTLCNIKIPLTQFPNNKL